MARCYENAEHHTAPIMLHNNRGVAYIYTEKLVERCKL